MRFCLLIICFTVVLNSCNYSEEGLIKYIATPSKGLTQEKTIAGVTLKATYRPQDLLVKQEYDASLVKNDSVIKSLKNRYSQQMYFVLSLSRDNQELLNSMGSDRTKFSQMLSKLSFGLEEQVLLVNSQEDTLQLLDYVFPRTYGMLQSNNILLSFENKNIEKTEWLKLVMKDIGLQTGDVSFKFQTRDILRIPKLEIQ